MSIAIVAIHAQCALRFACSLSRGPWGMPPRIFLKIKCYEIESGGTFSQ